ncbi:MAG TPA: DUF502 domain-containing protein [Phycisphaerae bacterium]|nr:DUF502 domain-containing protein [Phycisphaerales bacterium]HRX86445.1 DUF502 domain-containing protein [Phycisphaerae bacterium]
MDEFKRFFLRGLAAVLPTLLTIAIFLWAYNFIETYMGRHITAAMLQVMTWTGPPEASVVDPVDDALKYGRPLDEWLGPEHGNDAGRRVTEEYKIITSKALESPREQVRLRARREQSAALWRIAFAKYRLHLIGFVIAIIVVYFVGFFLASYIGRAALRVMENAVGRMPLVRAIYPNIKQVTDFLFGEHKLEFSGVVAVPYPRTGIWSVGLLTGGPLKAVAEQAGEDLVAIFIPSSPTPVTGYTIMVPRRDVIELAISIDEVLRFVISAGVIKPDTELRLKGSGENVPTTLDHA